MTHYSARDGPWASSLADRARDGTVWVGSAHFQGGGSAGGERLQCAYVWHLRPPALLQPLRVPSLSGSPRPRPAHARAAPGRGGVGLPIGRGRLRAALLWLQIQHTEDMENEIDELLQEFEEKSGRTFLHTVCFY